MTAPADGLNVYLWFGVAFGALLLFLSVRWLYELNTPTYRAQRYSQKVAKRASRKAAWARPMPCPTCKRLTFRRVGMFSVACSECDA